MATYVNDLRLKEIGTGESSGTWGTETNVNLELIGEALAFGTEAITTNADTHTSTVADGSTDPARAMYIKYTGTLDSACTITIAPNTMSRVHIIENGTSGSQNIIISQGSGANVTIPAGDVKVVYLDGAGSGAAVVDAFASLNVVDLKVEDDLTVTDDVTIGGILDITDTTDASDATGDTGALRTEGGASIAKKLYVGTDLDVDGTANLDVVDIDGAVDMASTLTVNDTTTMTNASNATQLILQSTDADSSSGPVLELFRNSGSPADNDATGLIYFYAENDNDEKIAYTQIYNQILDASDGSEDGSLQIYSMAGGTSTKTLTAESGYVLIGTDSGDAFNSDSMLRLQRTGDRVFIQIKTDADQNSGLLFGDVDDDVECSMQYEPANKALTLATNNNTERLRLDDSGNITQNSGTHIIKNAIGDSSGLKLSQESGDESRIFNHFSGPLTFGTGNAERKRIGSNGAIYTQALSTSGFLMAEITNSHLGNDSTGTADITFTVTFTNTSGVYDSFQVMLYLTHAGNSSPIEHAQVMVEGYQRSSSVLGVATTTVVGDARPISTSSSGLVLTITVQSEGSSTATQGAYARAIGAYYGIASIAAGNSS